MAKVKLGLDDSELTTGLAGAGAKLNAFQQKTISDFKGVGASVNNAFALAGGIAGVSALGAEVVQLLGHFDDIADSAKKLDISAESFQRMKLAAELSGASVDGLSTALLKMEAGLQRGGTEGDKIKGALESLNISVAAFIAAKPEEKLALLSAGFQKAREEGRGLSEIQDLFKKQFTELIPLLTTSAEEMAKISKEKVVSSEDVERLAAANDQLDVFKTRLTVIAGTSLGALMEGWDAVDASVLKLTGDAMGLMDIITSILGSVTGLSAIAGLLGGGDAPVTPPATPEGTPEAPTPQPASSLPGLQAAGVTPDAIRPSSIPGLDAATAPLGQSEIELRDKAEMSALMGRLSGPAGVSNRGASPQQASSDRASANARNGNDKYSASMLEALKRNNEILEELAR